jgi:hypothetical protein
MKSSDHVTLLDGEKENSIPVEDRRMRITRGRIGHRVFHHCAGSWIKLADISGGIRSEPDVAFLIGNQAVWP